MPDVTRLQPKDFSSDLDEIAREGARRMLAQALEAEVADYIGPAGYRAVRGRLRGHPSRTAKCRLTWSPHDESSKKKRPGRRERGAWVPGRVGRISS